MEAGPGSAATSRAKVSVGAVESLIQSLPGVEGARIVLDDWGGVREIHVLADSTRHPKSIVRDIESGLQARWGLAVDHRRISIAQLGDTPRRPKWIRLRLQQLAVNTDPVRGRTEVAVSLAPESPKDLFGRPLFDPEIPNAIWQGRASGSSGGGLAIRLAAEATLQALNQSLMPQHHFNIGEMARIPLGDREVVVCLLHYHAPRGVAETLSGSAIIRGDALDAAVRAVLNGTNRLYGLAMRRHYGGEAVTLTDDEPVWTGGEAAAATDPPVSERRKGTVQGPAAGHDGP